MASAPTRPTVRTAVLIAGVLALCAAAIWVVVDHMRVDLINEANQVLEARLRMAERHGLYHTVSRDAKEQPPKVDADGAEDAPDVDVAMRILYSVEPRRPQITSPPQDDAQWANLGLKPGPAFAGAGDERGGGESGVVGVELEVVLAAEDVEDVLARGLGRGDYSRRASVPRREWRGTAGRG